MIRENSIQSRCRFPSLSIGLHLSTSYFDIANYMVGGGDGVRRWRGGGSEEVEGGRERDGNVSPSLKQEQKEDEEQISGHPVSPPR